MAKFKAGDPRTIAAARKAAAVTNAKRPKGGWPASNAPAPVARTLRNRYVICVDASGSMAGWQAHVVKGFNNQVAAIQAASKAEGQESDVSLYTFGERSDSDVREIFRCAPVDKLRAWSEKDYNPSCLTPMLDCIGTAIERVKATPCGSNEDVSYVLLVITDGQENASRSFNWANVKGLIADCQKTDRWTFAFLVKPGTENTPIDSLGVPAGNVKAWEQSVEGFKQMETATRGATMDYMEARSRGQTMSKSYFQTDASKVTTKQLNTKLTDRSKDFRVLTVGPEQNIKDFVTSKRLTFIVGAGYYLLQKPETVQSYKQVAIMEKGKSAVYTGAEARALLGLPNYEVKVTPGNHANYDIFIQSTSHNRILPRGSKLLYDLSQTVDSKHTWAKTP